MMHSHTHLNPENLSRFGSIGDDDSDSSVDSMRSTSYSMMSPGITSMKVKSPKMKSTAVNHEYNVSQELQSSTISLEKLVEIFFEAKCQDLQIPGTTH